MKLSLVVTTAGKAQGQVIPITLSQFVIGRDPQCNLRPASALISKRHCAILVKNGQVFVRDFDSTNGTFVNNEPVKGEIALQNDDELKVGPLAFKVQIEQQSISKPTPPPKSQTGGAAPDDEAAAALLLSLHEDGDTSSGSSSEDSNVPAGSTVFDLPNPVAGTKEETPVPEPGKKPEAKKPDAKQAAASASKAAESLLAKYTRRQR
jgi:pSer/pThr/pTyr-binding forkhead associated (FHA) protein